MENLDADDWSETVSYNAGDYAFVGKVLYQVKAGQPVTARAVLTSLM